jgi:transketolase
MLLYSVLYLTGYGLTLDDLKNFRQLHSKTPGHPEYRDTAGVETTTGPLGQGISNAVGMALAERMLAARFNRPDREIVDHHTYTIASDGDLQEGVASEACSLAGHLKLGRLIAFYDDNHVQLDGDTAMAFSEDVPKRFEAYGWHVLDLGEDIEPARVESAVQEAKDVADRPTLIVMRTHIGFGSPHKQDTNAAHGSPLGEEEVRLTKEAYGWPADKEFYVPDEVLAHYREAVDRGKEWQAEWEDRLKAYVAAEPDLGAELQRRFDGRLPDGWDKDVPKFHVDDGMMATRKTSAKVIQWAAAQLPELVGGSADLSSSTLTTIEDGGDVLPGEYAGRNIHFGVREHGMGAIVNGLNLHYFRAFGGTFFNFNDYMKGAVRLAALMGLPAIFLYTHDSIGLGEDGPTHQPVEQLA